MSPMSKSGTVHLQDNSAKLLLAARAIPPPILAMKGEMGQYGDLQHWTKNQRPFSEAGCPRVPSFF